MGRPERPLDPSSGPVAAFAAELRKLRADAGNPSYRALARRTGYSTTTLSDAAGGRQLPSLPVTLAFVQGCGGEAAEWTHRWKEASAALSRTGEVPESEPAAPPQPTPPPAAEPLPIAEPAPPEAPAARSRRLRGLLFRRRVVLLIVAVWLLGFGSGAGVVLVARTGPTRATPGHMPAQATPTSEHTIANQRPDPADPGDGMDPIDARCGSPDVVQFVVTLDVVPVLLPDGGTFGELRMRHNPNCRTSWGIVVGSISPERKINIIARRPADGTVSSDSFAGTSPNAYGYMLSTLPGCVQVEAYLETPQGQGPTAKTQCR